MSKEKEKKCKASCCWDRYTCQRYDMDTEPIGTIHIIPESHKAGEEGFDCYLPIQNNKP